MFILPSKWVFAAVLASALTAGCGGDSSSSSAAPPDPAKNAQGVVDYVLALIASSTDDSGEPIDINLVTLATEDLAEPSPI